MSKDTNTGNYNTGYRNTGDCNTGDYNTGYHNTGHRNTGHLNTGNYNTGYHNTGYLNTGNYNTGDCNTGGYNTGDCNTGDYNTGMFNTDEPCMRLFNKESDLKYSEFIGSDKYPSFYDFNLTYWVDESKMTDEEKEENPTYKTTGGFLKYVDYKTAWKVFWRKTDEDNKKKFLNLPNFCPKIFKEVTGIDINEPDKVELTLDEIADKFDVDVKNLKIKK